MIKRKKTQSTYWNYKVKLMREPKNRYREKSLKIDNRISNVVCKKRTELDTIEDSLNIKI